MKKHTVCFERKNQVQNHQTIPKLVQILQPTVNIITLVATRWDTIVQYGSAFDTFHMDTVTD
jgi:hypothetical protein